MQPCREEFTEKFEQGKAQLVWATVPADLDTPVSAMLRLMDDDKPCFLLESVEKGEIRGRYSVIGLMPDLIWRCTGNKSEISYDCVNFTPCPESLAKGALASFRKLYEESKIEIPEGLPPMASGLVGTMGYDMVKLMEDLPSTKPDSIGIPDACFMTKRKIALIMFYSDLLRQFPNPQKPLIIQ